MSRYKTIRGAPKAGAVASQFTDAGTKSGTFRGSAMAGDHLGGAA